MLRLTPTLSESPDSEDTLVATLPLVVPTSDKLLDLKVLKVLKLPVLLTVVPKVAKDLKELMPTDKLPNTLMLNKLLAVTTTLPPSSLPLNKPQLVLNKPVVNTVPDTLSVVPKVAKAAKDPKPLAINSPVPKVLKVPKPPKLLVLKVLNNKLLPNNNQPSPMPHTTVTLLDTLHSTDRLDSAMALVLVLPTLPLPQSVSLMAPVALLLLVLLMVLLSLQESVSPDSTVLVLVSDTLDTLATLVPLVSVLLTSELPVLLVTDGP